MEFIKFKIKRDIWALNGAYQIVDEEDNLLYQLKGKLISINQQYSFTDSNDAEIFKIRSKTWSMSNTYILSNEGVDAYQLKQSMGLKSDLYVESLLEPEAFYVTGNIWGSEYKFIKEDVEFAFVSKNIWKIADTYGVAIHANADIPLTLAVVSIIDIIQQISGG